MPEVKDPKATATQIASADEMKIQLDEVLAAKVELETEKATLAQTVSTLTEENVSLKAANDAKDLELSQIKTELETAKAEAAKVAELTTQVETVTDELGSAKLELATKVSKISELEAEVASAVALTDEAIAEADKVRAQNALVAAQLENKGQKPEVVETESKEATAEAKAQNAEVTKYFELVERRPIAGVREKADIDKTLRSLKSDPVIGPLIVAEYDKRSASFSTPKNATAKARASISTENRAVYDNYLALVKESSEILNSPDVELNLVERKVRKAEVDKQIRIALRDHGKIIQECQSALRG